MLADFLGTITSYLSYLWPIKLIHQWERGIYLVNGKIIVPWRWLAFSRTRLDGIELPPGPYLALPFFCDVHPVGIAWDYVESGRLDLTLKDGRNLSCEATAMMRVTDLQKAYIAFHDYENDRKKMLKAIIGETLVEADVERFAPDRRGRLLGTSLLKAVREKADAMGHEVESVQVTTFILGSKTLRLLTEQTGTL